MRVEGVGYSYLPPVYPSPAAGAVSSQPAVVSKELMLRILDLTMYNQAGMAFKLARIAAQMYAGMNFDYQA